MLAWRNGSRACLRSKSFGVGVRIPLPAPSSIVPLGNGSPAPSEGALSPFESEGNNHLRVGWPSSLGGGLQNLIVRSVTVTDLHLSRGIAKGLRQMSDTHSSGVRFTLPLPNGGVAQRLVQRLHKALVGGPNPPSATNTTSDC